MLPDNITKSIASMGLLNGTIRIIPSERPNELGRPLFACAGQKGYIRDGRASARAGIPVEQMPVLEYLSICRFSDVAMAVASTIGEMSLRGPEAYGAVLDTVQAAGSTAMAVLEPYNKIWPDAMLAALPYLSKPGVLKIRPYARVFQCPCAIFLATEDGSDLSEDYVYEACRTDTGLLLASAPISDGSVKYTGWSSKNNSITSFWSVPVDLSQPWCVTDGPNGELLDASIRPMRLTAAGLNYYSDDFKESGKWGVVESALAGRPTVTIFGTPEEATEFLLEHVLAMDAEAGDALDPEQSHIEEDSSAAILVAKKKDGSLYWRRWDIVNLGK